MIQTVFVSGGGGGRGVQQSRAGMKCMDALFNMWGMAPARSEGRGQQVRHMFLGPPEGPV